MLTMSGHHVVAISTLQASVTRSDELFDQRLPEVMNGFTSSLHSLDALVEGQVVRGNRKPEVRPQQTPSCVITFHRRAGDCSVVTDRLSVI